MARIPLRAYIREIESLIDSNQIEEAVAHSRHILKLYPKCIDAYRMLGKAYLESQRYGDASDILQRVLSSVPDDFVSHVGMSMIREDEGNLDEAIWHMERAFEAQPANNAIQEELRRLYGRRDGVEPTKVRLTRGALARMYAKGDLLQQAIGELRTALAENSQRLDLQVLLARVYAQGGQRAEAADTCNAILRKLPYCLEANRIMAEILDNSDRADEAQVYRQRVAALDPYFGKILSQAMTSERVPEQSVTIDKLDWKPSQAHTVSSQPEWAASLGVQMNDVAAKPDQLPDWLSTPPSEPAPVKTDQPVESTPAPASAFSWDTQESMSSPAKETQASSTEEIPDWMKEAGWVPSTGVGEAAEASAAASSRSPFDNSEVIEDVAPGEIPDWLRGIAPEKAAQGPADTPSSAGSSSAGDVPDWIKELSLPTGEHAAPAQAGLPDWMLESQDEAKTVIAPAGQAAGPSPDSLPEWLQGMHEKPGSLAQGIPDWLSTTSQPAVEPQASPEERGEEPVQSQAHTELPDWLSALGKSEPASPTPQAELPDWIKESPVLPATDAKEPEIIEPTSALPDWLQGPGASGAVAGAQSQANAGQVNDQAAELEAVPSAPGGGEPLAQAELPDWLKEMSVAQPAAQQAPAPAESPAEGPLAPAELPDWLKEMSVAQPAAQQAPAPVETPAEGPLAPAELPDWLKEMSVAQPAAQQALAPVETPAEGPLAPAELPDWLKEMSVAQPAAQQAPAPVETPAEGPLAPAELPDWLKEMSVAQPAAQQAPAPVETPAEGPLAPAELPDWLKEMAPVAGLAAVGLAATSEPAPTSPDQVPAPAAELSTGVPAAETLPQPATIEPATHEPAYNLDDTEAAFAWLESLAVKQGASEALLLKPEDRLEQPPAWVKEAAAQEAASHETAEHAAEPSASPEAPIPTEAPVAGLPDWLLELSAAPEVSQGAVVPVETPGAEIEAGQTLPPAEPPAEVPDWLKEIPIEQPAAPETTEALEPSTEEPLAAAELPDWLKEISVEPSIPTEAAAAQGEPLTSAPAAETAPQPASVEPAAPEPAFQLDDADAAFAWLESLAVKQGASEALLLKPEDRLEQPPAWVQEAAAQATEPPAPPETPIPTEALAPGLPDWLHELNVEPEVTQPGVEPAETLSETIQPPETSPEAGMPDWLQQLAVTEETAFGGDDLPQPEEPASVSDQRAAESLPPWLQELAVEQSKPVGEPLAEIQPFEPEPSTPFRPPTVEQPQAESLPDLPAWLAQPEAEVPVTEEEWQPPQVTATTLQTLIDLNQATLVELERLPGIGFILAQRIVNYRETYGPFSGLDGLLQVPGFSPETLEGVKDRLLVEAPAAEATVSEADRSPGELIRARNSLVQGNLEAALEEYVLLIHSRRYLPQIISDLREALYRHPVDPSAWQALGDAHLRSDQIQEALDAYSKAEELLR